MMVSDDHGREALGCYGNPVVETPHLDALAADGVRFTNSFCTAATCSPSRATILTGLHNHGNGMYGLAHSVHHFSCFEGVETLPVMLKRAGYRTGRIGKKHYAPEHLFPFDWGFPDTRFRRDNVAMSEACREFIHGEDPFFLYWCSNDPHRSEKVLETHPCKPNVFGNPVTPYPYDEEEKYREEDVVVPPFLSDTPAVRAELAQYYQSISRLDRGIGRLMDILKQEGKYDSTLIIYVSDNGAAFPEAKTTLYDPGMRLPCIVRSPAHKRRGGTCDGLITWADLAPTILDFAGAKEPAGKFHGRSFRGIIDDASPAKWREEIFAAHSFHEVTNYYPMRVVRTKRHKFIWNIAWKLDYPFASDLYYSASWQALKKGGEGQFGARSVDAYVHRPRFELYDLEADPNETQNLAEKPEHRQLVDAFVEKIKEFQKATKDPWFHKWEYE